MSDTAGKPSAADVIAFAREQGIPLVPWQVQLLGRLFVDPDAPPVQRRPADPAPVDLGTHWVLGPALSPACELGHRLAILDGTHVDPGEAGEHPC